MIGPNTECFWSKTDYILVEHQKGFLGKGIFCDENGSPSDGFPVTEWKVNFKALSNQTLVNVELTFASEDHMNQLIEMGFEQGFAMAHQNLDELLIQNKL